MNLSRYKNIIFDLGGVILNIDQEQTIREFARLSQKSASQIVAIMHKNKPLLEKYELGQVDDQEFIRLLTEFTYLDVSKQEFVSAWNSVLLDIPKERIGLLQTLSQKHRIFLLSNTNHLHLQRFNEILRENYSYSDFASLFEEVYYSCLLNMRKPDLGIYEFVLKKNQLSATETAFLDDLQENVDAASQVGISGIKIERNKLPIALFQ